MRHLGQRRTDITLAFSALFVTLVTASAADVQTNWDKQCAKCHGKEGKGDTAMGKKLKVKDYTDAAEQAKMKDEEMVKVIKEGKKDGAKTLMKAYSSTLSDEEITALVKFVRDFAKK